MSPIQISKTDYRKLIDLIQAQTSPDKPLPEHLRSLAGEIRRASVREPHAMSPDIITLHSTARMRDLDSGDIVDYTLVFPTEADPAAGRISILAPLGTAMLGFKKGDTFDWEVPAGISRWEVVQVLNHEKTSA